MITQRITCANLGLREYPKHANEGLGRCKLETKPGVFVSYLNQRECTDYKRADEENIIKRMAWQDQLNLFRRGQHGKDGASKTGPAKRPRVELAANRGSKNAHQQDGKKGADAEEAKAGEFGLEA